MWNPIKNNFTPRFITNNKPVGLCLTKNVFPYAPPKNYLSISTIQ